MAGQQGEAWLGQARSRWLLAPLILLVAVGCTDASQERDALSTPGPLLIEGHEVQAFPEYGANEHVDLTLDVSYRQTPPVSGPHSPLPAACGVRGDGLVEEEMVHTFEHGAVGTLFEPGLARSEIRGIERLVRPGNLPVFSAPYEGLEGEIAVVSWGRRMDLETFDETAVIEFVERFAGDAPEGTVGCTEFEDRPYQGG